MDRFDAMTVFTRVVEAGSLSAAARSIPMSLTSVSRHLAALEQRLDTQLLRRTTRHLSLTDEGRLVYERAKRILSGLQDMEMTLSSERSEPSGRLRVSAPVLMGRLLIAPRLPAFLAQHPLVDVDLLLVDRAVNLVEEDIAVAVRVGRLPDSSLVARTSRKTPDSHVDEARRGPHGGVCRPELPCRARQAHRTGRASST